MTSYSRFFKIKIVGIIIHPGVRRVLRGDSDDTPVKAGRWAAVWHAACANGTTDMHAMISSHKADCMCTEDVATLLAICDLPL